MPRCQVRRRRYPAKRISSWLNFPTPFSWRAHFGMHDVKANDAEVAEMDACARGRRQAGGCLSLRRFVRAPSSHHCRLGEVLRRTDADAQRDRPVPHEGMVVAEQSRLVPRREVRLDASRAARRNGLDATCFPMAIA